jgi:hypothetical protein
MELSKSLGTPATLVIAAIAGASIGQVASKKVAMLNTTLGKVGMMAIGVLGVAYSKSDAVKGLALGIAVSGATGLISNIAGSINGVDGLGEVGQTVMQDPATGMMYMVNGVGEDYYLPQTANGVYGDDYPVTGYEDQYPSNGVGEADYANV